MIKKLPPLLLLCSVASAQTYYNKTTIPPTLPAYSIPNNATASTAAPTTPTNPTIKGINVPSETLTTSSGPFGSTNSLFYTDSASGGISLSGIADLSTGNNRISPFAIYIASDTLDTTTLTTQKYADWFSVYGNVSAGSTGGRSAIEGRLGVTGTPSLLSFAGYVGVLGLTSSSANLGGTNSSYTTYAGNLFGGNFNVFTTSGATYLNRIVAQENDVALALGASSANKFGLQIISTSNDAVRAAFDDSALSIAAQAPTIVASASGTWVGAVTTLTVTTTGTTPQLVTGQMFTGTGVAMDTFISNVVGTCSVTCDITFSPATTGTETGVTLNFSNFVGWKNLISFGAYASRQPSTSTTTYITDQCRIAGPAEYLGCPNANWGIDFHNTTFTSGFLKSTGYTVDGSGNETANSITATAGADLTGAAIKINRNASTNTTEIGDGTTSGAVTIGGGSNTVALNGTTTQVIGSTAVAINNGATAYQTNINANASNSGVVTIGGGTNALNVNGGTVTVKGTSLLINKNSSTNTTEIGDGTTSGTVTIGGGSDNVTINAGTLSLTGTIAGTSLSTYLASPPAIGGSAAGAVTGTTITATKYSHGSTVICNVHSASPTNVTGAGTGTETNLANCAIPAGIMGTQGSLRVEAIWNRSATTTNTTTYWLRLATTSNAVSGGSNFLTGFTNAISGNVNGKTISNIYNTDATHQQWLLGATLGAPSFSSAVIGAGTQDTAQALYVVFNCANTTSTADTCGIYGYTVELLLP